MFNIILKQSKHFSVNSLQLQQGSKSKRTEITIRKFYVSETR